MRRMVGRSWLRAAGIVGTLFLLSCTEARAGCGLPHPRVRTEFFESDAVFVGTVISIENYAETPDDVSDGWFFRISVSKVYRGPAQPIIRVFSQSSDVRFPLELHHTYLLFAAKNEDGYLEIDSCGNSVETSRAAKPVHQIEDALLGMEAKSGGEIRGLVLQYSAQPSIPAIVFSARGDGKVFHAVCDKNGWFVIRVPAGKYVVRADSKTYHLNPYDLSYDDPRHLVIQDGGGADVAFYIASGSG